MKGVAASRSPVRAAAPDMLVVRVLAEVACSGAVRRQDEPQHGGIRRRRAPAVDVAAAPPQSSTGPSVLCAWIASATRSPIVPGRRSAGAWVGAFGLATRAERGRAARIGRGATSTPWHKREARVRRPRPVCVGDVPGGSRDHGEPRIVRFGSMPGGGGACRRDVRGKGGWIGPPRRSRRCRRGRSRRCSRHATGDMRCARRPDAVEGGAALSPKSKQRFDRTAATNIGGGSRAVPGGGR